MNQKIKLIPLLLFSAFATQAAKDVKVMQYLHAGPITVNKPILTDSLNVDGKPFEAKNLVKSTIPFGRALGNAAVIDCSLPLRVPLGRMLRSEKSLPTSSKRTAFPLPTGTTSA